MPLLSVKGALNRAPQANRPNLHSAPSSELEDAPSTKLGFWLPRVSSSVIDSAIGAILAAIGRGMGDSGHRYKQNRFQQLRGFCYTAAAGSISKAAKRMRLSQPSVSQQIQSLESEIGVKLFVRNGSKIV